MSPVELGAVEAIGTLPVSAAQVFSLVGNPRSTIADLERVLRPDVGMTANLLRCANSVYYRGAREITSVKDAITRMGLKRVFEVVASASFTTALPVQLAGYGMRAEAFWAEAVAVGVLADRLGRAVGFTYPDLAFTAGLLHDLGKVVASRCLEGREGVELRSLEDERAALGVDHTELGETVGTRWHLPREIVGAIRWHHAPASAPSATLRSLAEVIQLARAASAAALGEGEVALDESLPPSAVEDVGLDEAQLAAIVEGSRAEVTRMLQLLKGAA